MEFDLKPQIHNRALRRSKQFGMPYEQAEARAKAYLLASPLRQPPKQPPDIIRADLIVEHAVGLMLTHSERGEKI